MIINKLVVKTGSKCTLRCAKCGEFNPFLGARGKYFSVSMEQLKEDIFKIVDTAEEISLIDIAGGEALTHDDLYVLIEAIAPVLKIKKIHVVSNGTIIPNESMLQVLKKYTDKVSVVISDYSKAGVDNTSVIESLRNSGVSYSVIRDMVWVDKSDTRFKNYDEKELATIAKECSTFKKDPYYTLIDGKLSAHCPTAGSLMYFLDLYKECTGEYINIREMKKIDGEVLAMMDSNRVLKACNYCVASNKAEFCMAGEQLK